MHAMHMLVRALKRRFGGYEKNFDVGYANLVFDGVCLINI